ncbi:MAG: glyoxalase [Actinomycetota bacterium]
MEIRWIEIADSPEVWADAGFIVDGDRCVVNGVEHRLVGPIDGVGHGDGVVAWGVSGVDEAVTDIGGIPTRATTMDPPDGPDEHPNGVFRIDHLVITVTDTPAMMSALEDHGLESRGGRNTTSSGAGVDMRFAWAGNTLLEVAGPPEPAAQPAPARVGGVAYATRDLDGAKALLGDRCTDPVDAVQPGRRIAALTRAAGSTVPVAFMTPHVKAR